MDDNRGIAKQLLASVLQETRSWHRLVFPLEIVRRMLADRESHNDRASLGQFYRAVPDNK